MKFNLVDNIFFPVSFKKYFEKARGVEERLLSLNNGYNSKVDVLFKISVSNEFKREIDLNDLAFENWSNLFSVRTLYFRDYSSDFFLSLYHEKTNRYKKKIVVSSNDIRDDEREVVNSFFDKRLYDSFLDLGFLK